MLTNATARARGRRTLVLRVAGLLIMAAGLSSCSWLADYSLGRKAFRKDDWPFAVIGYRNVVDKTREPAAKRDKPKGIIRRWVSRRREVSMYNLATAYMNMKAYHDAKQVYTQYQREFPDGRFLGASHQALEDIGRRLSDRDSELNRKLAQAEKEIARIKGQLEAGGDNPELLVALGHAYWQIGQFQSAGEAYLRAIELKPELRENPLLLERLIFDMRGNLVPIKSRDELVALRNERDPLVIENVRERRARGGDELFSARRRFFEVTGTVRNRSTRPILGVRVEVTFHNALDQIIDVGSYSIGTLYPQQSRPFIVRVGLDAEAMNNVSRYRCQPLYQQ